MQQKTTILNFSLGNCSSWSPQNDQVADDYKRQNILHKTQKYLLLVSSQKPTSRLNMNFAMVLLIAQICEYCPLISLLSLQKDSVSGTYRHIKWQTVLISSNLEDLNT